MRPYVEKRAEAVGLQAGSRENGSPSRMSENMTESTTSGSDTYKSGGTKGDGINSIFLEKGPNNQ